MQKNYKLTICQDSYNRVVLEFIALPTAMKQAELIMEYGVKGTMVRIERIDHASEDLEKFLEVEDFTKDEVEA